MKTTKLLVIMGLVFPALTFGQEGIKENEFSISTQLRPRAEYRNGALFPRESGELPASFINNRARLSMDYKRNDLAIKVSGQHVGVWGEDPQIDRDGRFMLNEAWAKLNFGHGFFTQLGRQALAYDDERILGALDWNVAGRFHDALKLGYGNNQHSLHLILAYNQNREKVIGGNFYTPSGQPYKTMQTAWYQYQPLPDLFKASFLLMNLGWETGEDGAAKTRYLQTLGTNLYFTKYKWRVTGTFYYQMGKNRQAEDVSAFMAGFRVDYKLTDKWSLMIGNDYLSGEGNNGKKGNAFDPLYGTHHKFYGSMDYFYASAFIDGYSPGLWDHQVGISYSPCNKLLFQLNYHQFLTTDEGSERVSVTRFENLGTELDFQFDYELMKNVRLSGGYSFMFGTETMDIVKGGNHKSWQDWGWISLNINPQVLFVKW